ncbi:MAG: DUF1015 domain-containing protein [Desulfobacteraceae bacterium]|nr:DUF1015 domain-containing protein [Desulfobacteraceae bacterium]
MAEFIPFKGIRYNPNKIEDLSKVIAPPYDVISPKEQDMLYQRHSYNIIRLILGRFHQQDNEKNNVHTRAAQYFQQWLESGFLFRDSEPSFYLTRVSFSLSGKPISRFGVVGLVRLESFEKGVVLPHERTFSKVKSERLRLMKASNANFSPIFGLYSDPNGTLNIIKTAAKEASCLMDVTDDKGLGHKLWKIVDDDMLESICQDLSGQCIYIADGHHRYETALNYRNWVRENNPEYHDHHPCNYVMMNLISMQDPGLVILPAHRLLKDVSGKQAQRLFDNAKNYFDFYSYDFRQEPEKALKQANETLVSFADKNAVGLYVKDNCVMHVLVLKPGKMQQLFGDQIPESLIGLDVTVLTQLLMMELLGFDQRRLDDEKKIFYRTTANDAISSIDNGEADIAFILNPTKIEQVRRVCESGLIMPRKSTYFYPKVVSGQVMNLLTA